MIKRVLIGIIVLCVLLPLEVMPQSTSNLDNKILFRKEWSCYLLAHTGGWGFGYRNGKHKTYLRKRMWEAEFVTMKHPKEKKVVSYYENNRSFVYGKLNSFYIFRGAYGVQKVLNGKPYWGGVELRWFMYGGLSLGITKPVYLYIVRRNEETGLDEVVAERFDPQQHDIQMIYGRGPFFKGFDHLGFYPGAYAKTGLNFEYGAYDELLKSIECGAVLDFYPLPVPMMAFNNKESFFLSLYLSVHLGKRKY
jgi:hypothetical protein